MPTRFNSLVYNQGTYELLNIEFNTLNGFPEFNIAGAKPSISNAIRYKHKSQITSSGFQYPAKRKIANFHPSKYTHQHMFVDIPLVLSFLKQTKQISYNPEATDLFIGEIGLDGRPLLNKITEKILDQAKKLNFKNIFIPKQNLPDLINYTGLNIIAYSSLKDLVSKLDRFDYSNSKLPEVKDSTMIFDSIVNNYFAKKVITIAVGSFSNILLIGEPGIGKSLLLKSVQDILPRPSRFYKRHIRTNKDKHPFYLLDSTITKTDLLSCTKDISIYERSNMGVLGINEINQTSKSIQEIFKSTLEENEIVYKGNNQQSRHSFLATMNPCKCGYSNSKEFKCVCNTYSKQQYIQKLGLPFLDRFDLFVDFNSSTQIGIEKSNSLKESDSARDQVKMLFEYQEKNKFISDYSYQELKSYLNEKARLLFDFSSSKLSMSMRRQVKTLRIALAITILQGRGIITPECIYEAITYQKFYHDLLQKEESG